MVAVLFLFPRSRDTLEALVTAQKARMTEIGALARIPLTSKCPLCAYIYIYIYTPYTYDITLAFLNVWR